MLSLPLGILLTALVVFFSVEKGTWGLYLNHHAIVIVIMGTATILLFSTPMNVIKALMKSVGELFQNKVSDKNMVSEFRSLATSRSIPEKSNNPLINYAVGLWESGVDPEFFIVLLSQKRHELENQDSDAVQALRNLAKYPPALGMTGTVIGLVKLFSQLGAEDKAGLGPALALAMTATFFGLIVANAVITPLADRLHVHQMMKKRIINSSYQALLLINRNEPVELLTGDTDAAKAA